MIARFVEANFTLPGPPVAAIILFLHSKGVDIMETTVKDDAAPLNASVRFLNAEGNETPADDVPQWTSSDEDVASVSPSDDGLSATVTINGKVGASLISVESVEADTGDTIRAQGTVTVEPSTTAVSGEVAFS